jgi:hypothetical protein
MYAKPLRLLEHVGKVLFFLLSRIVWKHNEKVEHHAVIEWLTQKSPWDFPGHALKILERISLHLLFDNLVPRVFGIHRQQVCIVDPKMTRQNDVTASKLLEVLTSQPQY